MIFKKKDSISLETIDIETKCELLIDQPPQTRYTSILDFFDKIVTFFTEEIPDFFRDLISKEESVEEEAMKNVERELDMISKGTDLISELQKSRNLSTKFLKKKSLKNTSNLNSNTLYRESGSSSASNNSPYIQAGDVCTLQWQGPVLPGEFFHS